MMKNDIDKAIDIIRDAGGKIVGRTRLQKTACLLELAGCGEGFYFVYHHYGPYCEELTRAVDTARMMGKVSEEEKRANWGGLYSIYSIPGLNSLQRTSIRTKLAHAAAEANPVALELAVTAAFFAASGKQNPWQEVEAYKPDKAKDGRLEEAKKLYKNFRLIADSLPEILS